MGPMWLGAEVTRGEVTVGPKWLGPRCMGPRWLGPRWLGAEVTRGRGGSGAEVSVNLSPDVILIYLLLVAYLYRTCETGS